MTSSDVQAQQTFTGYIDPKRKVGSQSEPPGLSLSSGTVSVTGYQSFSIVGGHVNAGVGPKYNTILRYLKYNRQLFGSSASLLDIGCSAGLFCFLAKESGFDFVTGLDHDPEYIAVLKAASVASGIDVTGMTGDWKSAPGAYDVVVVLALIHWIFSMTALEGSFESIFRHLAEKTKRFLLIEWVDPTDPAIGALRHTSANAGIQREPYKLDRFVAAGELHFGSIDARIDVSPTRRV